MTPGRITSNEGLTLAVDKRGPATGRPVVLLHGGGQTRHSWRRVARRLADERYFAISYDARGHGDSDWAGEGDYSASAQAHDLDTVLAR